MNGRQCSLCDAQVANIWRCDKHHRCDDCGAKEDICSYSRNELTCTKCHQVRVQAEIAAFDGDTDYESDVVCPSCGHRHSDSWEMPEGPYGCRRCEHTMVIERDVQVTYSTRKIAPEAA